MAPTTDTRVDGGPQVRDNVKAIVVGISGASSSGKTTIARLLRTIFNPPTAPELVSFIIHEDDFYKSDDNIPVTATARGDLVQDWDCIDALNIPQLTSTLSYVCEHGALPPRLKSKEDLNEATDSGVDDVAINNIRKKVEQRLKGILVRQQQKRQDAATSAGPSELPRLAFLEGFLMYAPPGEATHKLRPVHDQIRVPLFLPVTYELLKERREARTGYVTIGPAPTPAVKDADEKGHDQNGDQAEEGGSVDDEFPEQNFWTDPPGYVDDIVWPRYIADHAWLLLPKGRQASNEKELAQLVGQGRDVRGDAGVLIAPGQGEAPVKDLLKWAVDEVLRAVERLVIEAI